MATYIYKHIDSKDPEQEHHKINAYLSRLGLSSDHLIEDAMSIKYHWTERRIGQLLKTARPGDIIVAYEASHIACSTSQILDFLSKIAVRNIQIHFVKYNHSLNNDNKQINTQHLLALIAKVESDYISKRTTQALARRKAAGLPLGRPKGRGNKSLKLDKHKTDIKKYLELGISKASIAKLVDCHPQTLYDWLERNNIDDDKLSAA